MLAFILLMKHYLTKQCQIFKFKRCCADGMQRKVKEMKSCVDSLLKSKMLLHVLSHLLQIRSYFTAKQQF